MTEPSTAAGRAMLKHQVDAQRFPDAANRWAGSILAIEAEARAAALDEARTAVEAIESPGYYHPRTDRALAAIDALREGDMTVAEPPEMTGLPVDFQVQSMTHANGQYGDEVRVPLGLDIEPRGANSSTIDAKMPPEPQSEHET